MRLRTKERRQTTLIIASSVIVAGSVPNCFRSPKLERCQCLNDRFFFQMRCLWVEDSDLPLVCPFVSSSAPRSSLMRIVA
jgi:hypothetical protein